MGDNSDGSSTAAQGAQQYSDQNDERDQPSSGPFGFFNRLFGIEPESQEPEPERRPSTAPAPDGHQAMMSNLREMRNTRVEDVAVPRADVVAVSDTATLDEVVEVFRQSTYSRLPVFTDTLDSPIGFVHLKDIALAYGFNGHGAEFDIRALLRPLLYVAPSMPIGTLLQKMKTERIHMALVIDEYGGVDGLLTIEDLMEQIVGEIADEHDTEEAALWIEEAPGVYLCSARALVHEFETIAGVDLLTDDLDEEIDTLGGLVIMLAGRLPLRGEIIPDPAGHEFEIVDADPRMVKRVRVRLRPDTALDRAAE
ncbi:HlyC/CorC family transporter [Halovulum dunhuangense]|uniref:HlyC/CorC family transporter n=1 Tax=Halovulum dunhuangense TaxID=1505036 RepID=A0A849KZA4_9RHOB|nr:hemolysin family protein [Halovulum dunhuangense]NNU79412.1 HlyC/CorC family transporter [Halovulum dunhuangense]